MENITECLAFNIKKLRKDLGWTQEILAERSGKSWQAIQLIESSKRWPEMGTITAIANAFQVPETRLFLDPDLSREPNVTDSLKVICNELGFDPPKARKKNKKSLLRIENSNSNFSHIPEDIQNSLSQLNGHWDVVRAVLEPLVDTKDIVLDKKGSA